MKHMAMARRKNVTAPPPAAPGAKTDRPTAFDLWMDQGLHALFDGIKDEPIPAELLRLIEDDRPK